MLDFNGRYFKLNKILLMFVGLWPYQNKIKYFIRSFIMISLSSLCIPHLTSAIVNYHDIDRLMLNMLGLLTSSVVFIKMITMTVTQNNIKNVCESINHDWPLIHQENERQILLEYSEIGRIAIILYSASIFAASTTISTLPLIPKVLDQLIPSEQPRADVYILEGEFFVDRQRHFATLFCCDLALVFLNGIITTAYDTMYITSTQHCCALYAIVRYRLRNLKKLESNKSITNKDRVVREHLLGTIQLHQKVLSFTSSLNDSYSMSLFLILIINLLIIPLDACAIIAHLDSLLNLLPYIGVYCAFALHLCMIFWPGQRILDHGVILRNDAYCNEWYTASYRAKKLLLIFMLRCTKPSALNAGRLLPIDFETFSMIMRTAMSYITALASFR